MQLLETFLYIVFGHKMTLVQAKNIKNMIFTTKLPTQFYTIVKM